MKHTNNFSKLFMASAVMSVAVAGVYVAPAEVDAAAKSFKDIPKSHTYYKEITEMTVQGIINGYEDGTFKPNQMITRKQAAALLARAFPDAEVTRTATLKDVNKKNAYYNDIKKAVEAGFLSTIKGGNFRPNDEITRGEMAFALEKAYKLKAKGDSPLTDVSQPFKYSVNALYSNGITTGYEDKTFREKGSLSRAHFAVFMYRAAEANTAKEKFEKESGANLTKEQIYAKMKFSKGLPEVNTDFKEIEDKANKVLSHEISEQQPFLARSDYDMSLYTVLMSNIGFTVNEAIDLVNKAYTGEIVEVAKNGKPRIIYYNGYTKEITVKYVK